jgi:hypothetical protein
MKNSWEVFIHILGEFFVFLDIRLSTCHSRPSAVTYGYHKADSFDQSVRALRISESDLYVFPAVFFSLYRLAAVYQWKSGMDTECSVDSIVFSLWISLCSSVLCTIHHHNCNSMSEGNVLFSVEKKEEFERKWDVSIGRVISFENRTKTTGNRMLAVPEVDDTIHSSRSIETTSVTAAPATSKLTITDNRNRVASQTISTTTSAGIQ